MELRDEFILKAQDYFDKYDAGKVSYLMKNIIDIRKRCKNYGTGYFLKICHKQLKII